MNDELPPSALVETWIFIATSKEFEFDSEMLSARRKIKHYFGSIELAHHYLEHIEDDDIELYFI